MIPLYLDEHVPKAITDGLRFRGVDVLTVQGDNLSGISDPELLDRSVHLERALFTFDDDLLVEAAKRQRLEQLFYGVIYAHPLRISIGKCIKDLEILAKSGEIKDIKNQIIFLPLK